MRIRSNITSDFDISSLQQAREFLFPHNDSETLSHFSLATEDEIRKIITKSSAATCQSDPIPTSLIKECSDELIPVITEIVNASITNSEVPVSMKNAFVRPLLKKANLDPNILKNFRPVSNLSYLSKIIEKVVAARLTDHMNKNNLMEPMQSAYRRFHSTESALLRVQNDLLMALENMMFALVLLDLSADFDTLDHNILLNRLST